MAASDLLLRIQRRARESSKEMKKRPAPPGMAFAGTLRQDVALQQFALDAGATQIRLMSRRARLWPRALQVREMDNNSNVPFRSRQTEQRKST